MSNNQPQQQQQQEETDSLGPKFSISELSSVHEHDNWTAADAKTLNLDHLEDMMDDTDDSPYSDLYMTQQNERSRAMQQQQAYYSNQAPPQQQRQQQQAVHINQMFDPNNRPPPSVNNGAPPPVTNYYGDAHHERNNAPVPAGYVPNKYSPHYDPSMPDWEGATIAEHTMADISTVTPPPEDFYGPYTPPVAMIAPVTGGTPWEELEESNEERENWKNPSHSGSGSTEGLNEKERKLLMGLMILVGALVVVVAVVVPLSLKSVNKAQDEKNSFLGTDQNAALDAPSVAPSDYFEGTTASPTLMGQTKSPVSSPSGIVPLVTPVPTPSPSDAPVTDAPVTPLPTAAPQDYPTTAYPTKKPSLAPVTSSPTKKPTLAPVTPSPTLADTDEPTVSSKLSWQEGMSSTELEWLDSHNTRRKDYHESAGETYIPLVWSSELADHALTWAETLSQEYDCSVSTDPDVQGDEGQNVSGYYGGSGTPESPETMLGYWVEDNVGNDYPDNQKLTQVIWRATEYVGCASSVYDHGDRFCRVHVCNYIRPGNCNMGSYDDWTVPMLADSSPCGLECPAGEGCFWEAW